MPRDNYEPNRIMGFPRTRSPHARQGEEPQRMMGMPADWFSDGGAGHFRPLAHPFREFRQWLLRELRERRERRQGDPPIQDDGPRSR